MTLPSQPDPIKSLTAGAAILGRVLGPQGFVFRLCDSGLGSGGHYAKGVFERGDRSIELHFRQSLGLVSYRLGELTISHDNFMRFSGNWAIKKYPDFNPDPMNSFLALSDDLRNYFDDFLKGNGTRFIEIAKACAADPERYKGLAANDHC